MSDKNVAIWQERLNTNLPKLAEALPTHIPRERFEKAAQTAVTRNPDLKKLLERNPMSVLNALQDCAADGLLPNNREAALVTFTGKAGPSLVYIPMIAGVLKRMRQSGEVKSVRSRVVHENDQFEVTFGDEELIVHTPNLQDPGKPVAAYAIIEMSDGFIYREFMSLKEIMAVKNSVRGKGGPWSGPFEAEMWRKTVLKRAAKYCPFSSDIVTMLDRDDKYYDLEDVTPKKSVADTFKKDQEPDTEPVTIDIEAELVGVPGASDEPSEPIQEDPGPDPDTTPDPAPEEKPFPGDQNKTPKETARALYNILAASPHILGFKETLEAAEKDGRVDRIKEDGRVYPAWEAKVIELQQQFEEKAHG